MDLIHHLRLLWSLKVVAILLFVGLFLYFFGKPVCQSVSSLRRYASLVKKYGIPLTAAVFVGRQLLSTPQVAITVRGTATWLTTTVFGSALAVLSFFGITSYVLIGVAVVVSSFYIWRNRVRIWSFVKNKITWLRNRARNYWYNIPPNKNYNQNVVVN